MQFTVVTRTTLFAAALAVPSEVSARQAPLATLITYSNNDCSNAIGTQIPLYNTPAPGCRSLPAGIVGGKIFDKPRSGCQIEFHLEANCGNGQTYTWPRDNDITNPVQCFQFGDPSKQFKSYRTIGTCA